MGGGVGGVSDPCNCRCFCCLGRGAMSGGGGGPFDRPFFQAEATEGTAFAFIATADSPGYQIIVMRKLS